MACRRGDERKKGKNRHSAGSMISNGGDASPSNRVIVGRRSSSSAGLDEVDSATQRSFYVRALSIIATVLPSKKSSIPLECILSLRRIPAFVALSRNLVPK